ncbi:LytTR family DNA-binding domain-containing protein [Marivirga atlantica]|jgi:DNA-binding LytR/AlgR family response regulator|uniref:Response regulator n=1 Tax=Marivirga atlantica TaxID=1548457 RepID=A0A937AKU0_9BACT|nr:response regulator [Marivirga atlantica]MBL0765388.1 response regulator [Marivirga atlantica]
MIRCLIIDDEPLARKLLSDYAEKVPYLEIVGQFSSALDALNVINEQQIDLLFLDIQMPEITGVEFLKAIDHTPQVIFTTAYAEYALEGYELNVIDYLLKPFDFARFFKAAEKAKKLLQPKTSIEKENKTYIFLKEGNGLIKLNFDIILYIKGLKDYVRVVTKTEEHIVLYTFKELLKELPSSVFIRVHNSYIINIQHITAIEKNRLFINEQEIPIGGTFKGNIEGLV